jgi:hypothetical protein
MSSSIMSDVEVVFFAADPHSAPSHFGEPGETPRLLIDEPTRFRKIFLGRRHGSERDRRLRAAPPSE